MKCLNAVVQKKENRCACNCGTFPSSICHLISDAAITICYEKSLNTPLTVPLGKSSSHVCPTKYIVDSSMCTLFYLLKISGCTATND